MKEIFYLVAVILFIHELIWILSPVESVKKAIIRNEARKRIKGVKYDDWSEKDKDILAYNAAFGFFILVWLICGLFTFNWPIFALYAIIQILVFKAIDKLLQNVFIAYVVFHFISSLTGATFAIFVILNTYHLKIDLFELIMNLFK